MPPPRASALALRSVRIARCTSRWLDETPLEKVCAVDATERWLRELERVTGLSSRGGVCGVAYRARRRRFLSFVLLSRRTRRRHFDERTPQIGYVVAITAAAGVFALEIALLALVRWAARWLLQYSQLVHSFVTEMIHVDLEDLDIKLDDGLRIVRDLATSLLYAGACGLLATAFACFEAAAAALAAAAGGGLCSWPRACACSCSCA